MCKQAVKKITFSNKIRSQMCDKAILEIGGTLKSVPDC